MQDPNQSEARLRVTVLTLADKLHGSHEARLLDDPCMAATARDLILEDKILGSDSSSGPAIYGIRPAGLQELRAEKPGRRLLSGMLTLIGLHKHPTANGHEGLSEKFGCVDVGVCHSTGA
jgi:hypothetical protein